MRKYIGLLAAAGAVIAPGIAAAAGPTLSDILVNSGLTATGSLQGSYVDGFNKGDTLAGHTFDTNANTFSFNQANLSLAYQPTDGFGGLVNVIAGDDAKVVNGAYGSGESNFSLAQGFVQYAHGPLTVIAGRYTTLAGAEVIDGSLDTNVSRSFLFQLAEPLVHTGVRAAYKATDTITAYLGVNNSVYANAYGQDTNKQKTLEGGLAYAPNAATSLGLYDYYSRESDALSVNYMDFTGSYKVNDALTLVLNSDWYTARVNGGGESNILGFAGYLNYAFTPTISGSLRGEYLATKNVVWFDGDGKSNISEVTATVAYSPVSNFTLLGEVRYDMGQDKVYPDPSYPTYLPTDTSQSSDSQGAVEIKAIFKFGTPPPAA